MSAEEMESNTEGQSIEASANEKERFPEHLSQRPESQRAVAILLDSMLGNDSDEKLQLRAILSLLRMSEKDEERGLVGESGCLQAAIGAMRNFPDSSQITCSGSMLLANSAFESNENKDRIRHCRGIELLVALMNRREYDEEFQCWACLALRNLTNSCDKNQILAGEIGALEVLYRVLRRFDWNKKLLAQGVATLGNIACGGLDCQMRLRDCGCIEVVVEGMKRYPESVSVQEHCILALKNICQQNGKNQRTVGEIGGVELLTEVMRKNQSSPVLLVKVCTTLRYMCFEEKIREMVGRNGALILIIEALDPVSCQCSVGDVGLVLKALTNATFSPDENKQIVVRCGGIEAVMKVLQKHMDDEEVVESGLRVFRNVSDRGGVNCQLLENANVFSYAIGRVEHFKEHAGITEHVFAIVINAIHLRYDEERMGMSLTELKSVVIRQMAILSTSVQVQKLGRDVLVLLEKAERSVIDLPMKKNRTKLMLGKLKRIASGQGNTN